MLVYIPLYSINQLHRNGRKCVRSPYSSDSADYVFDHRLESSERTLEEIALFGNFLRKKTRDRIEDVVTRTGKKLELGLSFSYVGPERDSPGSSARGEPNLGEARGKRPVGPLSERIRGVSGKMREPRAGTRGLDKFKKKVLSF